MAKLYVFGIGGTGSRVLRSFTHLLAAGVKLDKYYSEVVPIIVDADASAGDKTDTVQLMQDYTKIYNSMDHGDNAFAESFFSTQITDCCANNYTMAIPGATSQKFVDYMNMRNLDPEDQAMMQMLYSEANLDSDMSVGFRGNPNIGSVVLNQYLKSADFNSFANSFQQGDAIFIISSIFGGTGASGFPLLLNNLRKNNSAVQNANIIANAQIGAISVLPYFILESVTGDGKGQIDSSTFIQKTRAALKYYYENVTQLNHFYYIGDENRPSYSNHDGGNQQKNDPHFVEFVSALAIFDFAMKTAGGNGGTPVNTEYYEYGIMDNLPEFGFGNLHDSTTRMIKKPMSKFLLFRNFISQHMSSSWKESWASGHEPAYTESAMKSGGFLDTLENFLNEYHAWLSAMSNNSRSFSPFNLQTTADSVFEIIAGAKSKKIWEIDSNFKLFNNRLNMFKAGGKNGVSRELSHGLTASWMDLFARATSKLVEEKLEIN